MIGENGHRAMVRQRKQCLYVPVHNYLYMLLSAERKTPLVVNSSTLLAPVDHIKEALPPSLYIISVPSCSRALLTCFKDP